MGVQAKQCINFFSPALAVERDESNTAAILTKRKIVGEVVIALA
jgi:hypothetical protein